MSDGDNITQSFDLPLKNRAFWRENDYPVNLAQKEVTLKIPPNTKNAQCFRVKELGAKKPKKPKPWAISSPARQILNPPH